MEKASRRFIKDTSKKYTRKFRLYPSFAYKRLDKWLNKMSLSGWHLVDSNLVSFLFEYGTPQNKVYFTYDAGWGLNDVGKYSIPLRYPFLDKTYGVKPKYSKLNSNQAKTYLTLEIDTQKVDTQNDVGYKELLMDRDMLYSKLAIRNALVLLLVAIAGVVAIILK